VCMREWCVFLLACTAVGTALVRAGVHLDQASLQAVLDYCGMTAGSVDVDKLLHKCRRA
jgi:hypothetical protein